MSTKSSHSSSYWTLLPSFIYDVKFFYKSPEFRVSPTFFLQVFTWQFWLAAIIINLLLTLVGWFFYRFIIKQDSILAIYIGVFVFAGQGWFHRSSFVSWKIYLIVMGLFSFMFLSAFNMFIASFISTKQIELPFTTVHGIIGSDYHLCVSRYSKLIDHIRIDKRWKGSYNTERCPAQNKWIFESQEPVYACEGDRIVLTSVNLRKL